MASIRTGLLVAMAACALPASAGAATPGARLGSTLDAVRTQRSVHYVSKQRSGTTSVTIVCDAGRASGIQRLTYREGGQSGKLTVIVRHNTAFLRGDNFALRRFLRFRASDATQLADRWLVIPHSSHAYATVAEDVTFLSAMDDLRPAGDLANVRRTTVEGRAVVGVRGTTRVLGKTSVTTLWIAATGKPLPLRAVTATKDGAVEVTYSRWNEPVRVRAPVDTVDPLTGKPSGTVA
jgi:hypothetical protein